ncbi:MAG: ABC transporter ATP-binding protein, partial [Dehalococcoidia bacterium]|nr:ABC transporter ATP-binding protein [Dehalococcoidia bacterium]
TNGLDPAGRDEMLDLVRRTGREFGIAIVMSSHLLGEIERVCDHLVVIEAGRLIRSAPIAAFTARTQVLALEVDPPSPALVEILSAKGFPVRQEGRTLLIGLTDERPYDFIRDTIADLGVGLVRMEQRRQTLEDLFRPVADAEETDVAATV